MTRCLAAVLGAVGLLVVVGAAAADDQSERWLEARGFVLASRAEPIAVLLGRHLVTERWNEILDESLYMIAPRGTWNAQHPAWNRARTVLATELQRRTATRLHGHLGEVVHEIVRDRSPTDAGERTRATDFFESPGGRAWLASREASLRERTYGLPFVLDEAPRASLIRAAAAAKKTLLHLPVEQTNAVYEFTNSPLGRTLLETQNETIARITAAFFRDELWSAIEEERADLATAVRAAVMGIPPASQKTYVGTVTMRGDRTVELQIEQFDRLQRSGTYALTYAPDTLHWRDVMTGAPTLAPGQTRALYVDARGRLSETP